MERPSIHLVPAAGGRGAPEEPPGGPSDDALMLAAQLDRQDAFEALVRRHEPLVLGLATRFLHDAAAGRDAAQDVFLSLWAERKRYRSSGRFRSYLVSMTLHRCNCVRRRTCTESGGRSRLEAEARGVPGDETPINELVERERKRRVLELLTRLPEKMRAVVILRFSEQMPLEQIAEVADMPLGTVKTNLFRGIRRLHALLAEERR